MSRDRRTNDDRSRDPRMRRYDEIQRQLLAKTGRSTIVFFIAGVAVGVVGAALVALLLSTQGVPFLTAWLVCTAVLILPGLGAALWKLFRGD